MTSPDTSPERPGPDTTGGAAILVTGGAGYIGSHACKALAAAGFLPVAFDNLSTGHADAVRWGPLEQGDVADASAVAAALERHRAVAVMHFAASAYVGESVTRPWDYYANNVGGIIGLLQGCDRAGVRRVVFSSSCAVYGTPDRLPITEDCPRAPINPYGRTKAICEDILTDYAATGGWRHVALRYFNAAGADPEGELGERHYPETHLIPLALMAALGGRESLDVFGTDYDTPDGTCLRDYIHVADLAEAHVLAVRYLLDGGESVALNLGTGHAISVAEVVATVARVTGRSLRTIDRPRRPGDPAALVADPARAARVLGFAATRSDPDRMIADAAPWFEGRN